MLAALIAGASASGAQQSAAPDCTYESCSYGIAVRWNGLAVTRGPTTARVTTLNFFFPRDVSAAFSGGHPMATTWAKRATTLRRFAAAYTDVGLLLLGVSLIPAMQGKPGGGRFRNAAILGGVTFALGVPLQFSADNALSRAVWFYNQRFTH